jgi:hypothetical protein
LPLSQPKWYAASLSLSVSLYLSGSLSILFFLFAVIIGFLP